MGVLSELKPREAFKYFEDICSIPHGSGNTKAISDYVENFAKEHSLEYFRDELGDIIIKKPAYKGYENAAPIMLQGHLDMVCEKNFETEAKFDFKKDPLKLAVMDDYVYAKGTTLGGDDGVAVAYMLAILADEYIKAPRLECVFTVDEETGMDGAKALDVSHLTAKKLINLDHEDEGVILTSCAGGRKVLCQIPVRYVEREGIKYNLVICGLLGGHSGTEIDKYHGNANLIMGRLLHTVGMIVKFDLIALNGGLQDNAIPREAKAEILIDPSDAPALEDAISSFEDVMKNEYRMIEPNITIYCEDMGDTSSKVLTPKTKERAIFLLMTLPDGIEKMSLDSANLVQTSSNAGIMRLNKENFEVCISIRSSVSSEKLALSDKIQYLTETIGGKYTVESDYPAWEYKQKSGLRELLKETYKMTMGRNPIITGIHAGLEVGIFFEKIKGLDAVAMGPQVYDIHTPKEKLSISSFERVYNLLLKVLEKSDQ